MFCLRLINYVWLGTFDRFNPHWAFCTRLSIGLRVLSFDEFFTPQHLSTTISMGRAVSRSPFTCSFKMKRNLRGQPKCQLSAVFASCGVVCRACSWFTGLGPTIFVLKIFFRFLSQLASNRQQHPSRVVTTSLRYRSEFPSLWTPLSRSRASLQLSDAALFLGRDNGFQL
jgi:hypothetical protein